MKLYSTKHISPDVDLKEAVLKGLPPDNGLYMPYEINPLPQKFWDHLDSYTFTEMAYHIAHNFIGDYIPSAELNKIIHEAYNFDAPLIEVGDYSVLELYNGPTLAFKDFGARFMGRLMGYFLRNNDKEVNILVATSGDTGSAVAHGFLNVEGIKVTILYPKGKVSEIQEKQFTTLGANITAIEIDGTFDDCQALVKQAFLDKELNEKLTLSSANSINIARLIPQSFYYIYAYKQLDDKSLPLYFSVPSGNFGNMTAGLFAKKMGLPITKMIAATNSNDVFTVYHETGKFEPKQSVQTISNAMDVGNPSNFTRMMDLYGNDAEKVREDIAAYSYNNEQTADCIKKVFNDYNYVMCPHTAVGYLGLDEFVYENDLNPYYINGIILATAHPVKFGDVVEPLIEAHIHIPERLKSIINGKKQSVLMSADFDIFKTWLLNQ
ncbi:MAG: threonine synthase [Sphingobacteriales bacterium]|nr:threonine synthase [Sphingobacteriales bacterium]